MAVPLLDRLSDLDSQITAASHLLVVLDYDGTLTPIVDHPGDANLDDTMRKQLIALAQRPKTTVAILSGRAIEDVQSRVGIEGLFYAGNHGLEIKGPEIYFIRTAPNKMQVKLLDLATELADRFGHIPGVFIENKRLTLSVHHRLVPQDRRDEFHHDVSKALGNLGSCFQMFTGHKVYEIRPRLDWHKGLAALWIRDHLRVPGVLPIYLGDDRTDEDAFQALVDGITIRVGYAPATSATYYLPGTNEVRLFLQWLTPECPQVVHAGLRTR